MTIERQKHAGTEDDPVPCIDWRAAMDVADERGRDTWCRVGSDTAKFSMTKRKIENGFTNPDPVPTPDGTKQNPVPCHDWATAIDCAIGRARSTWCKVGDQMARIPAGGRWNGKTIPAPIPTPTHVWLFNINRRVYPPRTPGSTLHWSGPPIYREHWERHEIVRSTSRSFVTYRGIKVPRTGGRGIAFTQDEVDRDVWVHDNQRRIAKLVERCQDYETLRRIDAIFTTTKTTP